MSTFHVQCKNTEETSKLWHSLMPRIERKSFSVETKLRKVQKVKILTYLKILFAGRCWEQLDKGWHGPTSAASPSSPDSNPFPNDMEGDVLQPWRMVIITIATIWETRNPPKSALQWKWVPGFQLNKCSNLLFLCPSNQEGTTELPVTEQLALLTQQTCLQVQRL